MIIRGRSLPLTTYRRRRRQVAAIAKDIVGQACPILVLGVPESDLAAVIQPQVGKRRQDPWFDWFCGCHEPDAALLIDPNASSKDQLFLDPGDAARIVWDGARLQPGTKAKGLFGVHAARPIDELRSAIDQALKKSGGHIAMLTRKREPGFQAQQFDVWKRKLRGSMVHNIEPDIIHLRMVKDADEIALHKQAVRVTTKGLKEVFKQIPRLKTESQVAGELLKHYVGAGHDHIAFSTIVGAGVNAATLHYPHNDQPLVKKGCVLIDSGASHQGYAADVTRTVPQHGAFSDKRFKEIYELVLQSQLLGIKHARAGITLKEWNEIAWAPILEAGFTRHHGLGHHLGLDVHDPADVDRPLEPGMLITCEPGIYLPEENIGVRIEDNLIITDNKPINTTKAIPKTCAQISAAMGK